MKILFFLVAIANVAFFMWEIKTGAFVPVTQVSEQTADPNQEQILLVSELKNIPQVITPAPVSEQPMTEIAATGAIDKPALVPELSTVLSENSDKPALEKSTALDMNFNELIKIPPVITPEPPVAATNEPVNPAPETEPLPALPEGIEKPVIEKPTGGESNTSDLTNVPPVTAPAPVSQQSPAENTATGQGAETAPLPAVSTSIDKPALEIPDSNVSNAGKNAAGCYEVGPFANQQAYQALVSRLKDIKIDIKPINRDDQVPSNYMVYFPAAESEIESKANIKMLKDHGIKDLWLLTGEDKGKISLGLFIKEDSALVMKNELLAKGINAEVKAKYKTKTQKYALIKGDNRLMGRLDDLKKAYPELVVKQITEDIQGCR